MALQEYIAHKGRAANQRSINVIDLMNKAKFEEKREKRRSALVVVVSLSVLAATGLIIVS